MDWIHSTHLETLSSLDPAAAMLGLVVWTRSGGAPYQASSPRYPVHLGTLGDCAEFLGMSRATVKRAWPSFSQAFVGTGGRYTPALDFWPDPATVGPRSPDGRPLYVRIARETVDALASLSRCAPARTAWAAFRLALRLLPRLRAAACRGVRSVVWTNDQIAKALGMGRTTLGRALALLERRGLIVTGGARYRRIRTDRGLLSVVPECGVPRKSTGCGKPQEAPQPAPVDKALFSGRTSSARDPDFKGLRLARSSESEPTTTCSGRSQPDRGIDHNRTDLLRSRIRSNSGQAPREALGVDCPRAKVASIFLSSLPGLSKPAALELARHCDTQQEARDWLIQESNVLRTNDSAAGSLLWLARSGDSRPGRPSSWSDKLERQGIRRDTREPTAEEAAECAAARAATEAANDAKDRADDLAQGRRRAQAAELERQARGDLGPDELARLEQAARDCRAFDLAKDLRRRLAEHEKEERREMRERSRQPMRELLAYLEQGPPQ